MTATSTPSTRDRLFVDSAFLIALVAADDQYHTRATEYWRRVSRTTLLLTTTYVVAEVLTFFKARRRHSTAVLIGNLLITSGWVELLHVDQDLFRAGWEYLIKHGDKRYSFTDCISFVVMQSRGLREALTFDTHFQQAGFTNVV
ncbi:MAG TPA: PIN domain-containing protein [Longimicrobium sp.]|jgi:predicted nucleic acid-binding protein|nr:PIN domain-containing protein [Longimicrobium sp.]